MKFDLATDDIVGHRWTKLNAMLSAGSHGAPFFEMLIGPTISKWFIDKELVEEIKNPPWPSRKTYYRITDLGRAVIKRGRYAKLPNHLKLKFSEPRVTRAGGNDGSAPP